MRTIHRVANANHCSVGSRKITPPRGELSNLTFGTPLTPKGVIFRDPFYYSSQNNVNSNAHGAYWKERLGAVRWVDFF